MPIKTTEETLRWMPRWMGPARVLCGQLESLVRKRSYKAVLRFQPVRIEERDGKKVIIEEEMIEMVEEFYSIIAINIPWLAHDAKIAPNLKTNDGLMSLQLIREKWKPTFIGLAQCFLEVEHSGHLRYPFYENFLCSSLFIDPLESGANVVMDGICIGSSSVSVSILPSLLTIIK